MSAFIGLSGILAHAHTITWGRGLYTYVSTRESVATSALFWQRKRELEVQSGVATPPIYIFLACSGDIDAIWRVRSNLILN